MPTARNDAPRLRTGTVATASITSTYAVTAWTVQSDMQQGGVTLYDWLGPYQMLPPERARVRVAMDGTATGDGDYQGVFGPFSFWTFGMMDYFCDTYLSTTAFSALASAMFFDNTDTAIYLNLTIYRPIAGQDMEPAVGGWKNIRIRYAFGSVAA